MCSARTSRVVITDFKTQFMTAFNDNNITDAGRCDINLNTPKPVPFQHRHHLHRQQTLLHANQKPGIKTPVK